MGDDLLFLAPAPGGPRALAFPDEIDLTEDTLRWFPDLADLVALPKPPGWPKRQLRGPERFGARVVWDSRPTALVFPRIAGTERSELAPLDRDQALLELVGNILLTDAAAAQAHLDTLAALVDACACYRLDTGRDFDALPSLLAGLLA